MTSVALHKNGSPGQRAPARPTRWLFALAAVLAVILIVLISRAGVGTPFQDELAFTTLYRALAAHRFPPPAELLAAHNGHPYLILKLLISVTHLLRLPWTWMMYAQVAALSGCALVIFAHLRSARRHLRPITVVAILLVLFTPRQWENLYWAMQLAFPLFLLFSLAAFACIERYSATRQRAWATAALACGLLASLSNGAGIFALAISIGALVLLRPRRFELGLAVASGILGVALFAAAQMLAPRSGVGSAALQFAPAAEHATRMFAHQLADFPGQRVLAICVGLALMALTSYLGARAVHAWPRTVFEALCIVLSVVLILGVTYSRVTAQIMQPDASRYLPLVAPLTIGLLLLCDRWGKTWILWVLSGALVAGYVTSLRLEWGLGAFRHEAMAASHARLCVVSPVHIDFPNAHYDLSREALRDLRELFCHSRPTLLRVIDHRSIVEADAAGYHHETDQTWIQPRLRLRITPSNSRSFLFVDGWLPGMDAYPDGRFTLTVLADDVSVGTRLISVPGSVSETFELPAETEFVEIIGTQRGGQTRDVRQLSWILRSLEFESADALPQRSGTD